MTWAEIWQVLEAQQDIAPVGPARLLLIVLLTGGKLQLCR